MKSSLFLVKITLKERTAFLMDPLLAHSIYPLLLIWSSSIARELSPNGKNYCLLLLVLNLHRIKQSTCM